MKIKLGMEKKMKKKMSKELRMRPGEEGMSWMKWRRGVCRY